MPGPHGVRVDEGHGSGYVLRILVLAKTVEGRLGISLICQKEQISEERLPEAGAMRKQVSRVQA